MKRVYARGGVAERLNALVLKTSVRASVPGVRIPPPPRNSLGRLLGAFVVYRGYVFEFWPSIEMYWTSFCPQALYYV